MINTNSFMISCRKFKFYRQKLRTQVKVSAIPYHPSLSVVLIYHPESGWHVTSSDQGLSFPEERAWVRGCLLNCVQSAISTEIRST